MKKVLLIKISSMGDLIQALPALTDASKAIPGIRFDWVVETSFSDVPKLHPSIDKVIAVPTRRLKKNLWRAFWQGEIHKHARQLREQHYDMVIDAQCTLKSAFVSLFAKGRKYGLDAKSVHEYGAQLAYHQKISINPNQHHVQRVRQIMAHFLGYPEPTTPVDYGVDVQRLPDIDFELPKKFVFIAAITSRDHKLWPEPFWQALMNDLMQEGYDLVLPWWSQQEHERVLRLKNNHPRIHLLPKLNLLQQARVLTKATATISIDTGLAHIAAALNIPNITLYGPADPTSCGTTGKKQIHIRAKQPACAPCNRSKCTYQGATPYQPACMASIKPEEVFNTFLELTSTTSS